MKVFLSWSGDRSRNIAETLRETLPLLMNAVQPWMSEQDIDKGERWNSVLGGVLDSTKVGIFCLTPTNITRPALLFEAGAISKSVTDARVCVLLDAMKPSNLEWPWSQFQGTRLDQQKDMLKLLGDINRWLIEGGEPALAKEQFTKQFNMWWPEFQKELSGKPAESNVRAPERSEREMLVEILELLRSQKREAAQQSAFRNFLGLTDTEKAQLRKLDLVQAWGRPIDESLDPLRAEVRQALIAAGHTSAVSAVDTAQFRLKGNVLMIELPGAHVSARPFDAEARVIMLAAAQKMNPAIESIGVGALGRDQVRFNG
jgi:hypothetical protein